VQRTGVENEAARDEDNESGEECERAKEDESARGDNR
jgi:hypothetical protein